MAKSKEVANTGPARGERGSKLIEGTNLVENHKQPQGKSIGAGGAPTEKMHHSGTPHVFHFPPASNAHGYRHQTKSGPFRLSGDSKAHRIGARKK